MVEKFRRINILIREDQYQEIAKRNLSLSGLVRDALDDRISETSIVLSLSKESKRLYDHIISNFGASDLELEHYIVEALDRFLIKKTKEIEKIRDDLRKKTDVLKK